MKTSTNFIRQLKKLFGLEIRDDTELEEYCKANYTLYPNFAYKNKRKIRQEDGKETYYSIFVNECITPNCFGVKQILKSVKLDDNRNVRVKQVGNLIAKKLVWTSDMNLDSSGDYYLYPNEVLATNKGDCEDHSFVMTSCLPEDLAGAWGFYNGGGHAFNVMLFDKELYVVDTVGDEVFITAYKGQSEYKINYIITPKYTFALDSSVQFGEISGWEN